MEQRSLFADRDWSNEAFSADGQECSALDKGSCGLCHGQLVKECYSHCLTIP